MRCCAPPCTGGALPAHASRSRVRNGPPSCSPTGVLSPQEEARERAAALSEQLATKGREVEEAGRRYEALGAKLKGSEASAREAAPLYSVLVGPVLPALPPFLERCERGLGLGLPPLVGRLTLPKSTPWCLMSCRVPLSRLRLR